MAKVACFCGCLFAFDVGAASCPKCGEIASVTVGPVPAPGRSDPETPAMNGSGQNGHTPAPASRARPEGLFSSALLAAWGGGGRELPVNGAPGAVERV